MARLAVSVANCTLTAGLNPPLGIFIFRVSASVVLTRSSLSRIFCPHLPWPARFAASSCFFFNSGNWAIACSSRCCFSLAARRRAAFCRADNPAAWAGDSNCCCNSSTPPHPPQHAGPRRPPPPRPSPRLNRLADPDPAPLPPPRHHHPHRMARPHQIVRTLHPHRNLPPLRSPQPYLGFRFLRFLSRYAIGFAHALTYTSHP